jgi:UDP-glucose 4-epimerase
VKTVLITGVAGFLGRYVARHFVREGWRVLGIDDVPPENVQLTAVAFHRLQLPSTALPEILRATAPDVCVHCAGRASVPLSMAEPKPDFEANAVLTFELLDALRLHAPRCRLLFLSSAAVYGDPAALPVTEDQSVAPLSPYGYHKRHAELLCEEFSRIYGLPTAVVRIFSAYGPGLRRQVLWDICSRALMTGHLSLGGTGEESRDFIHAGDVAAGLRVLAERAAAEGRFTIWPAGPRRRSASWRRCCCALSARRSHRSLTDSAGPAIRCIGGPTSRACKPSAFNRRSAASAVSRPRHSGARRSFPADEGFSHRPHRPGHR